MNETLRKLSEEVKAKIAEVMAGADFKALVENTKAATDSGSFEVIISTADIDRQGESVSQSGWELDNYLKNPIVLWGHDYYSLPIGICTSINIVNGQLVARGQFAPEEANPFAQQVRRLYDLKIVRATSVGFIAKETDNKTITKAELLEFSFVPVPANPFALSLAKAQEMKLDLAMLATKGLKLELKEEEKPKAMGDECEMDDGEMGTMQDDGNGGMACMPKKSIEKSPACRQSDETKDECVSRKIPEIMNEDSNVSQDQAIAIAESVCSTACESKGITAEQKSVQQIGAILAEMNNIVLDAIIRASKLILNIFQTEFEQSVAGKAEVAELVKTDKSIQTIKTAIADLEKTLGIGEGEEPADGGTLKSRSEDGQAVPLKELNQFLEARELVASVHRATQESLEKLNKRISDGYKSRKLK